jgi:hypothetical protein
MLTEMRESGGVAVRSAAIEQPTAVNSSHPSASVRIPYG